MPLQRNIYGLQAAARIIVAECWPNRLHDFESLWNAAVQKQEHGMLDGFRDGASDTSIDEDADLQKTLRIIVDVRSAGAELIPAQEFMARLYWAASRTKGLEIISTKLQRDQPHFGPNTLIAPIPSYFALAYSHESSHPTVLATEEAAKKEWENRSRYQFSLYRPARLGKRVGKAVIRYRQQETDLALRLKPLGFRILFHVLKFRHDESHRAVAEIVRYCWNDKSNATAINNLDKSVPAVDKRPYYTGLSRARSVLKEFRFEMPTEKSIVRIDPWPRSYCVIEEDEIEQ